MSKPISRSAAAAIMLVLCTVVASAQVTQATGKVMLKQADGTEAPVSDAKIIFYRTDINQKFETKTNRRGEYVHAGLPFIGTYTVVVCAPGASATYVTGVNYKQGGRDFTMNPGDGSCPSLDEVKKAAAAGTGTAAGPTTPAPRSESKEEREAREKAEKERAEIESKNKKIVEGNEIVRRTFNAGNEALKAKRYDDAIAQYREGIAAREDEAALWANLSEALRQRGVERFNASVKSGDAQGREAAFQDWREAAQAGKRAVEISKAASPAADPTASASQAQNRLAALSTYAEAMKLVGTRVDQSQADQAYVAYVEYADSQTDAAKKARLRAEAAKIFFDAGAYDRAIQEYQKIIAENPDNPDANLYLGFSLFNTGDKAKFQEAANYIARFVEKAPADNAMKGEAQSILDFLKTNENIRPERIQPTRTTGGRRRQ